ncbi:MAG: alpha/beta hydrolase [Candidatus Obscuribacterales bacterium]|nr:alpha/beta hydrolase [Candidatus Obscuribacterales bacterium]
MTNIFYKTVDLDNFKIAYREAGDPQNPKLLLLHGFPSSSHMFRNLIPHLSQKFHLVAPDLPGFGNSDLPPRPATFAFLSTKIEQFVKHIGFEKFSMYLFDYGAPTGFRLALQMPEQVTAIISQNGNTYEEGLSEGWSPIQAYWRDPTDENRNALKGFLSAESVTWQYTYGVSNSELVSPDGYSLDNFYLQRAGVEDIQLDLLGDYKTNVALYPEFQKYLREYKPSVLALWGENDPFFLPTGAEAFKRDVDNVKVRFFDTGHFALETHAKEIAEIIRNEL